jgi:glycine cleavage system transcriptional repressor
MSKKFILTAFSPDRPGIVADISQIIFENGFNLEDSSMTYLGGEFVMMLQLSAPPNGNQSDVETILSSECRRLEREKKIFAFVSPASSEKTVATKDVNVKTIAVEGEDQSGIVYKISRFLADSGINIRTLSSKVKLSPQSGTTLYVMSIVVEIPSDLSLSSVENGLGAIGDELRVDVSIE